MKESKSGCAYVCGCVYVYVCARVKVTRDARGSQERVAVTDLMAAIHATVHRKGTPVQVCLRR